MTHFEKLLLTLGIIAVSLCVGFICARMAGKGKWRVSPAQLDSLRHRLQTIAIFALLPLSAALSLWGLPRPDPELLLLPIFGLAAYVWGGCLALVLAWLLGLNKRQAGSFYCCGTFSNIGAVGGLACLMFLGENSIALVALYRLVEEVYYFSVSFPVARWHGEEHAALNLRVFKFNPVLCVIVFALLCGMGLNIANVPRPELCGTVASLSMILATISFLFAIGLTIRPARIWRYGGYAAWMCAIKFIGAPVVITWLAWLSGIGEYDNGLALKTVAVLSSMPVAMTALVPPALFGLDVDLANACWIFSTAALVVELPLLMLILPVL